MTTKNTAVAATIALCAVLAAGAILASNMGFKINKPLNKAGSAGSKTGTNTLGLPYIRRAGIETANDLIVSINGGGPPFSKHVSVARFIEATDTLGVYTARMGSPSPNFSLAPGEGLRIQMSADVNYIVVGNDDPSVVVMLNAPGAGSKSGTNDYAPPYNITAVTAFDLIKDIEGVTSPPFSKVVSVSRFLTTTDSMRVYTGRMASPGSNFTITPGESYRIQMSATVPYVASHY